MRYKRIDPIIINHYIVKLQLQLRNIQKILPQSDRCKTYRHFLKKKKKVTSRPPK